jgi:predicted nucleic acid-binding protein
VSLGKRRTSLLAAVEKIAGEFAGWIAPRVFAKIYAARTQRASRLPIRYHDRPIARAHRAAVATRNTADFEHCGIQVMDPWKYRER